MKQLALGIIDPPEPTFDNFVAGRNAELVAALCAQGQPDAPERLVYLWGEPGSGRSHLLRAAASAAANRGARVAWFSEGDTAAVDLLLVDDVEQLDADRQADLFVRFNEVRDARACLLAAGNAPPPQLPLRADHVTRLAWGLVYQVHALTDADKAVALEGHARARGLHLPPEVSAYLLRHERRDLRGLMAILDALDRHSLAMQRPITVPLLREWLQEAAAMRQEPFREDIT